MSQRLALYATLGLLTGALACIPGVANAQALGTAFTYQGQLTDADAPASGLFDLQLCLYDVASGSTPLQCAPDFNDVPVDAGVFTIGVDFGAGAFIGQQRYLELRVRPGASTSAYTTLAPRQLVRAAPEALRANVASAAPWSGLTGVPAGFADGIDNVGSGVTTVFTGGGLTGGPITTSGTVGIAAGGVVGNMIALGAVGILNLADNAVDSQRIVNDSITASDVAANAIGASELNNNAVDTAAIQDAQVTAAKIAPGAIGGAQIDPTQVQARVTGTCGDGEYFRGINADGSLACELLPVSADRVLDLVGEVGTHVAVALRADQRPLVAYHDQTNGNLKVYDCADAACASGTRRLLDSSGDVGENVAIAIAPGGLPVIAYRNVTSQVLRLYACANAACSSGVARTLDSGVNVGSSVAMALRADGRPFITYQDFTNFRLRVYDCADAACSSGTARGQPATDVPYGMAIAFLADGRALVAMGGNAGSGARMRVFECADLPCTTGTTRLLSTVDYAGGGLAMLVRTNGRPLIVVGGLAASLAVHDCADAACVTSSRTTLGNPVTNGLTAALRDDGRALLVFGAPGTVGVQVFDCAASTCATGSSRSLVAGGNFGSFLAMALRGDGRPVVAYYDTDNDDLRLHICANPDCT
jgi:hypothetical protein